jgi:hypothetical protein
MNFLALAFAHRRKGESMKNVLAVTIALIAMPVLVQAADITEALSTTAPFRKTMAIAIISVSLICV